MIDGQPLADLLGSMSTGPGVYLLKNAKGKVLYVGKAKNLRSRVRMYFHGGDGRLQIVHLVRTVTEVETLVTRNEKEALILENNLIKQYKPRYNIRLKDDKTFVSVKATVTSDWPGLYVTRKIKKDGSRYFGPFHSAWAARASLDSLRKVFPLRNCSDTVFRNRSRPCLEYQIKRCPAPCCGEGDRDGYQANLRASILALEGKSDELVRRLRKKMATASQELRYEDAARYRDQMKALEKTTEPQEAVSHFGNDQDVFGLYREGGSLEVHVLAVRRGRLTGSDSYSFDDREFPDDEVLSELFGQYYTGGRYLPDEVLTPVELPDAEVWESYLGEIRGKRLAVLAPQRGVKARLVTMAADNARQGFHARRDGDDRRERMAAELQKRLHLRSAPKRIECFDISNFQGEEVVGSMVVFDEGEPAKNAYRRFRIRGFEGQDDFASMQEVLRRRFKRAVADNAFPDLLVVDGGKGQLGVATAVLEELGITNLDVVGLAKERVTPNVRSPEVERSEERVFLPGRKNPVILARNSTALFLLQRVRDEAHRFAITFHRERRAKSRKRSALDDIAGVGPERRKALLSKFGSVRKIEQTPPEELSTVAGIGPELATEIVRHLREASKPPAKKKLKLRPLAGIREK